MQSFAHAKVVDCIFDEILGLSLFLSSVSLVLGRSSWKRRPAWNVFRPDDPYSYVLHSELNDPTDQVGSQLPLPQVASQFKSKAKEKVWRSW